jgi:hypothetical protein
MHGLPRINLLARTALPGLLYRALAGEADGGSAPLTQRRIELLQAELTQLTARLSTLRADLSIAQDKASAARRNATQAQLDWRLFMERYEEPRRGLLRRLTPQQQEAERRRAELEAIAAHEQQQSDSLAERAQALSAELLAVEARLKEARSERAVHGGELGEQLAAHTLGLIAAGQSELARDALDDARREVRGDVQVAVLLVFSELLKHGDRYEVTAARAMLDSLEPVFTQQPDGTARTLALLLAVLEGRHLKPAELGLLGPGNFNAAAHYRLYQLVLVLAGGKADSADVPPPWFGTLELCVAACSAVEAQPLSGTGALAREPSASGNEPQPAHAVRAVKDSEGYSGQITCEGARATGMVGPSTDDLLSAFESEDVVRMVLAAAALLLRGELELLPQRSAWIARLAEERQPLLASLPAHIPAWPQALAQPWNTALACFVLLALYMDRSGTHGVFGRWREESYGWPKSDLYWWMLATLGDDPALLRNLTGGPGELFVLG